MSKKRYCVVGKMKFSLYTAGEVMIRAYIKEGLKLSSYLCRRCHRIHLTKQKGSFSIADAIVKGIPVNSGTK